MEFILRPWKASDINSLIKYANNWKPEFILKVQ
jgi:hypothetical protein